MKQEEVLQQPVAEEQQPTVVEVEQQQWEEMQQQLQTLQQEKEKLQKTVDRLQSSADKSDMYLGQLVAMKSDFESYKRRMKFNAEQAKAEGIQSVALKLIDIADTFEIAKKHLVEEQAKAFEMVHQQFVETLHSFGVEEMDVVGKPFDHMTMNALSRLDCGPDNTDKVVEVYKAGYTMGEKVLRYAEVIVGA